MTRSMTAIDAERRRHGVPTSVDRPAAVGDLVTLDLVTKRDGEEVTGLNTEDWSYEIGQGWITDDFDDQLVGASSGDVLEFTSTPKGTEEPADFTVTVKSVDEMDLPALNDEWVGDNFGEFETVEEWRASQRERISELKLNQARQQFMGKVSEALTALVDIDAPESMVQSELQGRVQNTVARFQANGIDLQQWLSATGQDTNEFMASMKTQSEQAVKLDLALRAVANAEGFEMTDDDLDAEYQRVAMQVGEKVAKVKKAYEQNDAVADLTAQIRKSKALEWLMHNTDVVDTDGNPIDNDELLGHSMDDRTTTTTTTTTTPPSTTRWCRQPRAERGSRVNPEAIPPATSFPTSSSRRAAASAPTTSTAVCSRRTSSSCRRRSTTRSPA